MSRKRTPDYKKGSSMLSVLLMSLGIVLFIHVFTWLFIFLIAYDRIPGWLSVLLLFLYFAVLILFASLLYRRGALQRERACLGDEVFFAAHPREWKRELRRWKRVSAYRAALEAQADDTTPQKDLLQQKKAYDELYYRISSRALKRDLKLQQFGRRVRERLTRASLEPSPYEQRLIEITEKLRAEQNAGKQAR